MLQLALEQIALQHLTPLATDGSREQCRLPGADHSGADTSYLTTQ